MADDERPQMPLVYFFWAAMVFLGLNIICMIYAIVKKYRRIQFELRV